MPPAAAVPTNQPKICNLPSKFIDRLNPLKQKKFSGFSVLFSSPPPCSSAKRPQSRCEKPFPFTRLFSRLHCSAPHSRSLPSCDTAGISAYTFGFSHKGLLSAFFLSVSVPEAFWQCVWLLSLLLVKQAAQRLPAAFACISALPCPAAVSS